METSVKERLTGALILVAALVVLVPEMLSGPRDRTGESAQPTAGEAGPPLRTYNLVLDETGASRPAGQSTLTPEAPGVAQQAAAAVPAPESPQSDPPPAAATEAAPPPAAARADSAQSRVAQVDEPQPGTTPASAAPAPATPAAAPAAQPLARPAAGPPAASAPAGRWWTQLGSFSSRDNAERLARELRGRGFTIDVSKIRAGGKDLYRVRSGPVTDRAAAVALQSRLAAAGHKSSLVAP